jgi:hypothetical protein
MFIRIEAVFLNWRERMVRGEARVVAMARMNDGEGE